MIIKHSPVIVNTALLAVSLLLAACTSTSVSDDDQAASAKLTSVLDSRSAELKARDISRHPKQTIEFFGVTPGMKIAEVLPGGGWYSKILAPYVGSEGAFYGINYADTMWPMFGFFKPEVIAQRVEAHKAFGDKVATYPGAGNVPSAGYAFGGIPESLNGTLDAVIMVRALHNLNRFEAKGGTRTKALKEVNAMLKPGGIVGVVQHRAPADADDEWANGSNGYLKQADVVAMFEQAGFELVGSSEINANPKDQPVVGDSVWRLPPSLRTSPENKAVNMAIGETDRMTLKFVKK
ncbi:class I SAM-dependent methyltransferase [Oceanicoccus sagamiensis]|uniref:Methyltransferase n=1 Tax=Oceanicoccus sagamiensis TaxID=716816 RepID=A0A1X9N5K2_9GAMM|nr:class I SAM-dependent methyltransferase [Oceanicoccus sagamiensis]ARN73380.1 methyltransferase [Oceanicoccus sagamiensis]